MTKLKCRDILKKISGKKNIFFTKRCNQSIFISLEYAKDLGKSKVLIQDQGGWLTYLKYPLELGMEIIKLKTDFGIFDDKELLQINDNDSVLLVNSLPGYIAEQPFKKIVKEAWGKKAFVINDVSGSIGRPVCKQGDIIVGSFGRWKPVNLGNGGFLATNLDFEIQETELNFDELYEKLKNANDRVKFLNALCQSVKSDLKEFNIIHKNEQGLNVIVCYGSEDEKNSIVSYCERNKYEFTQCPRYIRVNERAISIEVKRREQ